MPALIHRSSQSVTATLLCLAFVAPLGCGETPELDVELPRREAAGPYTIVRLEGTPYEMGQQHAELLREELIVGGVFLQEDVMMQLFIGIADAYDLGPVAESQSYPEIVEECQGLVDTLADENWTMRECLLLNFGDVVVEILTNGMPDAPGCSQIVAAGAATSDGRLYHARLLDWFENEFVLAYPVIFVREPTGELPHVFIGFPGNLSPYTGMNVDGLTVGSNEVSPPSTRAYELEGRSHVQLVARMLAEASSLSEARALAEGINHISWETIVVTDGDEGSGEAYEMSPLGMAVRELEEGVLFELNHFAAETTVDLDVSPIPDSSAKRQLRLEQLVLPDGDQTVYGELDRDNLLAVVRDRIDPDTGEESSLDTFDDDLTLATNGALYSVIFDPERRHFWLSAGTTPVPQQSHRGFSLLELLGREDPNPVQLQLP